jgi:hypothetical protein
VAASLVTSQPNPSIDCSVKGEVSKRIYARQASEQVSLSHAYGDVSESSNPIRDGRRLICFDFDRLGLLFRFYPDDIDVCLCFVTRKPMLCTVVWVAKPMWITYVTGSIVLVLKPSETVFGTYVRVGIEDFLGRPD